MSFFSHFLIDTDSASPEVDLFAIPWAALIAHLIATISLVVVLIVFVRHPLERWLARRREHLAAKQTELETSISAAEKNEKQTEVALTEAQKTINQLMQEAKQRALSEKEKIVLAANFEKENILQAANNRARQIESAAYQESKKTIVDHSLALTTKLLKKQITAKDHQKMIDDFVKKLDE